MKKRNIILKIVSELQSYPKWFYSSILLTFLISFVSIFRPIMVNRLLNRIEQTDTQQLIYFGIILILLLFIEALFQYGNSVISVILGQKLVLKTRKQLFHHVLHLPVSYFDKTPVGTIVTRVVSDMEAMNEIFSEGFTTILGSVLTILIFIATMLFINVKLTLSVLSVLPLLLFAVWLFKNAVQKSFTQVRNAIAHLNRFIQERLMGMSIIQQFNAEKQEFEKFKQLNQQHRNAHVQSIWYYSIFFPVLELLSSIAIAFLIYTSSILPNVALGDITFFVMMTQMLFRPLRMLADQLNTFQMGLVAAERVYQLLDEQIIQENDGKRVFQHLDQGIEFKGVSFYYQDKKVEVLSDINLFIPAKKVTAIVGHTGSGKSTLISLITRLYDIKKGEICIDNIPVQEYTLSSLRSKIAVVLQDPHLFNDTLLNNVRMFNSTISKDLVENAAKEIGIHDYIVHLEHGYDYIVQERGTNLSSGQKQLIAFLRAYIHHPEIFILDEATSMMDSQTEQLLQSALKKILINRTAIIIAHRLSTIQMADQIVVMHRGKIEDHGTHQQLIEKEGIYREIYETQLEEVS